MKNFVILCLSITTSMAIAQDRPKRTPEERAQRQTEWMEKNLGFTQEQNKKVYDIILYYAKENDKTGMEAPGREKKMEKQGIKKDRESELRGVLTPEQMAKYEQHLQEMKARQGEKRAYMNGN